MRPLARRLVHRVSGSLIAAFAALHLGNHMVAVVAGQVRHIAVMEMLRPIYRNPVAETVLLAAVAVQLVTGVPMALRALRVPGPWLARLQPVSGLCLAVFLAIHVSAVISGRVMLGVDTNFNFAAAGFHAGPWILFFVPYYFLAVAALFLHLACALWWLATPWPAALRRAAVLVMGISGIACATLIVLALAGHLHPVSIPAAYLVTYGS